MAETVEQKESRITLHTEERMREPRASSARYDAASGRVVIELTNGCTFMFPAELAQGLRGASPELLAEVEVEPFGLALHWEQLDADLTVAGLLTGTFGTKRWMAELEHTIGGAASESRQVQKRENDKRSNHTRTKRTA